MSAGSRRPQGFLSRLRADQRGVSAVEFALIAPLMIFFYFGLGEFCQGYMAQKRMAHVASSVADLVAQTEEVTTSNLDDVMEIGGLVMKPFSATALTTTVTSVTRNTSGVAKVDWSRSKNGTPRGTNSNVTVPADVIANGESLIMTETTYKYESPVKYLMPGVTTFKSTFYLRPRRSDKVTCSNCPNT